jgi:hypothetical protein
MRIRAITAAVVAAGVVFAGLVAPAEARSEHHRHEHRSGLGSTTVTTAPGIAGALIGAGVAPLPVPPRTGFRVSFKDGLAVSYRFPITSNTANLAQGSGDINHAGGILFVSGKAKLEIGKFDIDLAAGKIYARQVNFAPARIAVLDLDLSGLQVRTGRDDSTVLSGIGLDLDPVAAGALNSTFGLSLPTDGSLRFGTARVVIKD